MPLSHTVELNAATIDTDTGPQLHATWTWAASVLDRAQIGRLSQLWFDALTGICAHVQRGGGGLTPSDIAPARLSQHQIDELQRQYRIADILPLTPLQQGLLFHTSAAHNDDDCTRCSCRSPSPARWTPTGCATPCTPSSTVTPTWPPGSANNSTSQCRSSSPNPNCPGNTSNSTADVDDRSSRSCAAERAAVCNLTDDPAFRVTLIRTAKDRHRIVLTNHHIVLDGWSLPILAARDLRQLPRASNCPRPSPYRRFVTWLAERDLDAARDRVAQGARRLRYPHPGRATGPSATRARERRRHRDVRAGHPGPERTGALAPHHRQHGAAGGLGAAADAADRPARRRFRHRRVGAARRTARRRNDGRPDDQHRAGAGHTSPRPPPPTCSTNSTTPTITPSTTNTWRSTRFTAPPATTNCSTPYSSTRTTQSTPLHC